MVCIHNSLVCKIWFFGQKLYGIEGQNAIKRAKHMIDLVKLSEWADVRVAEYSFGMRKRLNLARTLVNES